MCNKDPELDGPKDVQKVEGSNTSFSCLVEEGSMWQYKRTQDASLKPLALEEEVFVEKNKYAATYGDVGDDGKRRYTLTVKNITRDMDGTIYRCVYKTMSSCAELSVHGK